MTKLEEAKAARDAARVKMEAARDALAADLNSEDAQLARLELESKALERERVRIERERAAEPVYRKACLDHGELRVAKIRTVDGPLVFRPMTMLESEELDVRQECLKTGVEKTKAAIEAAVDTLLYPSADEFRAHLDRYPMLVIDVLRARNSVSEGVREEERGKG